MKHFWIFLMILSLIATAGAVAQTQKESDTTQEQLEEKPVVAEPAQPSDPEVSKVPRKYPIAAGVWYPGEPLPKEAFRYYRIRCWPGCHHNSQYGMYPDKSEEEHPENQSKAPKAAESSEKQ